MTPTTPFVSDMAFTPAVKRQQERHGSRPSYDRMARTRDRPFVIQCGSGYRSTIAASLLEPRGFEGLVDLIGGWGAWQAANLPAVVPESTA